MPQMPPHMSGMTMQQQQSPRNSYARNSMGSQYRDMNPSGGMQSQYQHPNMPSGNSSGMNNAPAAAEWKPKGMVPVTTTSPSPSRRASSLAPSKRLLKKAKTDTEKATSTSVDQEEEDAGETVMGTSARKDEDTPSSSPRGTGDSPLQSEKSTIIYPAESIHFCKLPSSSMNSAKDSSLTEGRDPDVSAAFAATTGSPFLAPEGINQTRVMIPAYPARISPGTVQGKKRRLD
jgi:hypothetical protein